MDSPRLIRSTLPPHCDHRLPKEQVILVKIDGSAVIRLAHHHFRSGEYYWAQSRAPISRDGRYVIFDSNMDLENTGLNNYSDVYMIKVRE